MANELSSSSSSFGWYHHNYYSISSSCHPDSLAYVVGFNSGFCRQTYDEQRHPIGSLMYRYDESNELIFAAEYADLKCREPRTRWVKGLRRFAEVETEMHLTECESIEEDDKPYGLPDGEFYRKSASRSIKISKQQRLPLSGEYAVQLGFDSLQDCRNTRFSNYSHTAKHSVYFAAYASNITCASNNQGKYIKYDCSSGSPVLYTFADQYCERLVGVKDVNKLCSFDGVNSAYTYWTCTQTGLVLPLVDTREDEHVLMDNFITVLIMTVVFVHFCVIIWRYFTDKEDAPIQLIPLPQKDIWNAHSRIKDTIKSQIIGLNRKILDLQQENESLRSVVSSKDEGIKILQKEIEENAAMIARIEILENELEILRNREKQMKGISRLDPSHNLKMDVVKSGDNKNTSKHHHHGSHGHRKEKISTAPVQEIHRDSHLQHSQQITDFDLPSERNSTRALEARLLSIREKDKDDINASLSTSIPVNESDSLGSSIQSVGSWRTYSISVGDGVLKLNDTQDSNGDQADLEFAEEKS